MRRHLILGTALAIATAGLTTLASQSRPDYPYKPVPFTKVHLNDVFWAPRIETNRTVTIPSAFQQCERTQRVYHFERAAKALQRRAARRHAPPGLPVRRHRPVQGHRRRVLHVERLSRIRSWTPMSTA